MQLTAFSKRRVSFRGTSAVYACLVFVALLSSMALAEDKVSSRVNLYVDNDETTIVSPMIYVQKNIFDETSLSVRYITDIQSCASVDVVSTASPSRGYEEIRHEVAAGLKHRINLTSFGATYRHSTENDYDSNSVSASFSQELFQRNFTVDLSVSYRKDKIGRVKDRTFSKDLEGGGGSVSLTQILTPKVIGQFVYYLEVLDGYQSSPYRLVPVADFHVPETHPDRRIRQSFTGRLKESLSEAWGAEQSFRFYTDTWGLNSKTIFLQFYYHINNPLTLRLRYRFYNQERADFYREYYPALREHVSRDRELGTLHSHLAGPQLTYFLREWKAFGDVTLDVKLEYFHIDYDDYALLEANDGLIVATGFSFLY